MDNFELFSIPMLANGSGIHIKKENRGKFTETKKRTGKTTEELTHSKNPLTRKRAIFAQNSRKWKHEDGGEVHKPNGHRSILDNGWFKTKDLKKNHPLTYQQGGNFQINNSQPQVLQRYISLVNQGIPQQAAFDTSHLSIVEDGRPGKYYSFGRRASNLGGWTKNATDSLTNGRYKNLQNVQNFGQFKQGLKQKNYNNRLAFYNVEINRGRDKNKQIINQWNKTNGLPLIAGLYNQNINQV